MTQIIAASVEHSSRKILRAAAYCRVSKLIEEQECSFETQKRAYEEMIAKGPNLTLVKVYSDHGISGGSTKKRRQFQEMIQDCRLGLIDVIYTKSISRFARNTVECLSYVRELRGYGVSIYFEKEKLDTESAVSEMVLSIMAAVAQEESRNISENLKWGFRKRFAEGFVKWSPTYGYKKVDGEEFVIDPETAPVVQRIFSEYVHGKTLPEIIKGLNEDGIRGARGGDWYPTRLTSILSNEKYIGDALCQKTYVTDHITHTQVKNDQTVIPSYYICNNHEPIVSRKVFYMAREIRSMRDHHIGPIQYPYRGRITCPVCGAKLEREVLRRDRVVPVWHCRPERGNLNCAGYYMEEKYMDMALRDTYRDLDRKTLKKLARDPETAEAAEEAIRMKEELPELGRVEYYFLDAMVREIRIHKWDALEIVWKCGLTGTWTIPYDNSFDTPFSKEQMSTCPVKQWMQKARESRKG